MTVEENDRPVQQPVQQDEVGRGEERTVKEWVEFIREKGAAFLHSTVARHWKIDGAKKASRGYDEYGLTNISDEAALLAMCTSFRGKAQIEVLERKITSRWSYYLIAGSVAELIGKGYFSKLERHLFEEGRKEKLGEDPGVLFYVFGMPPIPEIGEFRQPIGSFCLLLTNKAFQELKTEIKSKPLLIEEIFCQFYPGLIESGMKSYQANQLFFLDIAPGEAQSLQGKDKLSWEFTKFFIDKGEILSFPETAGEVPRTS